MSGTSRGLPCRPRTYREPTPLDMSRRRVTESRHAPARGRVRTPGHGRGGDLGARDVRRRAPARRRPDARERHEGARGGARRARRPRRSRRAAHDRLLVRRDARDRRDGHVHAAHGLLGGRGRAADPGRGRVDDRRRPGAKPRHDRRQRLRERPDEPLPGAPRRARRDVHDPRAGRRANRARRTSSSSACT